MAKVTRRRTVNRRCQVCSTCWGTGEFLGEARMVGGKLKFDSRCFRCEGKGYTTPNDRKAERLPENFVGRF